MPDITSQSTSGAVVRLRARRGSAIFLVMVMTIALAALAASAMLMASGAGLVSNYHSQERDLLYGAEAALQTGMSDLTNNPYVLPESGYVQIASNAQLVAADGSNVPNVVFDLYAGPTGSATQQQGRFVTVVAIAKDTARQRAIHPARRAQSGDVLALRVLLGLRERDLLRLQRPPERAGLLG